MTTHPILRSGVAKIDRTYYWVVAGKSTPFADEEILAEGFCAMPEDAETALAAALDRFKPDGHIFTPVPKPAVARALYKTFHAPAHDMPDAVEPVDLGRLYSWSEDGTRAGRWIAHPITKITPKRIFIQHAALPPGAAGIGLDRARLERDGSVFSRVHAERYFAAPQTTQPDARIPRFERFSAQCELLGLSVDGFTRQELEAAFRRAALECHPDQGGSASDFRAVVEAKQVLAQALWKSA